MRWPLLLALASCAAPIDIDVQIVEPCNQEALAAVKFLWFEPRGRDLDSAGLTSVQRTSDPGGQPIPVPLTDDFHLVVNGFRESLDEPPAAIGVSSHHDLVGTESAVSIRVPFALVDRFYKTTDLAGEKSCTELGNPRYGATATYIPQIRQVLVVGGVSAGAPAPRFRRAIELYDPATGRFSAVGELRTGGPRAHHTATLLADGRVLIAGGVGEVGPSLESLRSALIVDASDPTKVRISDVITLRKARSDHTAVALDDGRVLLAGGRELNTMAGRPEDHSYLASVEIYDPAKNIFFIPDDGRGNELLLSAARAGHSATLLASGQDVFVAGGFNSAGPERSVEVVRVMGERIRTVTSSAARLDSVGPLFHAATRAPDGRVLLSGGYAEVVDADPDGTAPRNALAGVTMWSFDAASGAISRSCSAAMSAARGHHSVTIVGRQRALFAGGHQSSGVSTPTAEVVTLTVGPACFPEVPRPVDMNDARARHAAVALPSGEVLLVGGLQKTMGAEGRSISGAEIFSPARVP